LERQDARVHHWREWMGVLALWLAVSVGVPVSAQLISQQLKEPMPPAPPFLVRDESGVFARDLAALRRMSDVLRKLEQDYDLTIYLVIEPVLLGQTVSGYANQLNSAWQPGGGGFVIVYEADSRAIGLGRSSDEYPIGIAGKVGPNDLLMIWTNAVAKVDSRRDSRRYIESLVVALGEGFDDFFQRKNAPLPQGRRLRTATAVFGCLAVLGLLALGVRWLVHRADLNESTVRYFPILETPERLGAPFGGGKVSVRRFVGSADHDPPQDRPG
jgi:hypothetical protein